MHSIVTIFRGAVIKVEVANFCAAMDTLIDQDGPHCGSVKSFEKKPYISASVSQFPIKTGSYYYSSQIKLS